VFCEYFSRKYWYVCYDTLIPMEELELRSSKAGLVCTKRSFGGTLTAQLSFGTLVAISTFSIYKAWTSIRELEIDRHRVWVLRAWSYVCSVRPLPVLTSVVERLIEYSGPHTPDPNGSLLPHTHAFISGQLQKHQYLPRNYLHLPDTVL
jgi:hypothetical protein